MPNKGTIPRACKQCGAAFLTSQERLDTGRGVFCSRACTTAAQTSRLNLICETCGKFFQRKRSLVRSSTYCSIPCRAHARPAPALLSADGLSALLPLQARDGSIVGYTTIDTADVAWAQQWRWHTNHHGRVVRNADRDGRQQVIWLHRELLSLAIDDGIEGDHVERDPLNNRRSNLRVVTRAQNAQNLGPRKGTSSDFRGVFRPSSGRWIAYVNVNRKRHYLGRFDSEEAAAEAARAARAALMPYSTD